MPQVKKAAGNSLKDSEKEMWTVVIGWSWRIIDVKHKTEDR